MRQSLITLIALLSLIVVSTTVLAGDTTVDQNKATLRTMYDQVFNQGKADALESLIAPDAIDHQLLPGQTSPGKCIDNLKAFIRLYRTAFPDLQVKVEDMIAEGDKVVARCRLTGTQKGEFMGIPPTGKPVSVEFVDIVRFQSGKCAEHWGFSDDAAMLHQLGVAAK